jgi:hypothetical protein
MQIHWHNLFALVLGITVVVLLAKHGPKAAAVISQIQHIGPGHSSDEQTLGLIVLGILAVAVVAIVKLLTQNRNGK